MERCVLLVVLLLVAACGGAEPEGQPPRATVTVTTTASAPDTPPPTTAEPSAPGGPAPAGVSRDRVVDGREAAREAGLDPTGAVAGLEFRDANGRNLVVLRQQQEDDDVSLRADHVALFPMTQERDVLRQVRDGVQDCEFDVSGEFLEDSLEVRDDDEDGVGEVVFVYRLGCRSDVSAAEQKLLLLEGGTKHILRGRTATPYEDYEEPAPEPAPGEWPDGSHDWAQERFRELADEFGGPQG